MELRLEVTPAMLDPEHQHLHHARILELLEKARVAYLASKNASMETLIAQGIFPVVTDIHVKYLREVKGGEVIASCAVKDISERELIVDQTLINERGKISVTATVICKFLYRETGRAGDVPKALSSPNDNPS